MGCGVISGVGVTTMDGEAAKLGLALSVLATWRIRLIQMEGIDLTPSLHWGTPVVDQEPAYDRGPVLVTLAYQVNPAHLSEFLRLMERQRVARQRDGAFYWQLFQDAAASDRYLETFLAESWLEHLRHHERVTQADRLLQDKIGQCLVGESPAVVTHYLAVTEARDQEASEN